MSALSGRAAALILRDGRVALIERRRETETYYLFPGGRIEQGETAEQCVEREVFEELGLEVQVERLVAQVVYDSKLQLYYSATLIGGVFGTGVGEEYAADIATHGIYIPRWTKLSRLAHMPVHPQALVPILMEVHRSGKWPTPTRTMHDLGRRGVV